MIDKEKLITWLNDRADEKMSFGTPTGRVQYAVLTGLRDRIVRGDFDMEDAK